MKEYLITGNVVERKNEFDNSEPIKGFIVGEKIIYQNGWDVLDRVKHLIVKIYKSPIVKNSSWCLGSKTNEGLICVWEKTDITEVEKTMLENIKKRYQYIARDLEGSLWLYESKPYKNADELCWKSDSWCCVIPFDNILEMITWEDERPTKISDLIGG